MSEKRNRQLRSEKRKLLSKLIFRDKLPEAKAKRIVRSKFPRALKHQQCRILAGKQATRYQVNA